MTVTWLLCSAAVAVGSYLLGAALGLPHRRHTPKVAAMPVGAQLLAGAHGEQVTRIVTDPETGTSTAFLADGTTDHLQLDQDHRPGSPPIEYRAAHRSDRG